MAGVGHLFTRITQSDVAKISAGERPELAPILAESYLAAEQYVKALDAASYFLTKKELSSYKTRLLKVRGHSALQEGDWQEAMRDLAQVKPNTLHWDLVDELSLIEAELRSGLPSAPTRRKTWASDSGQRQRVDRRDQTLGCGPPRADLSRSW